MSEILLCRPCAEELKADDKVNIGSSMRDKETCEYCGKRRFVYKCTKKPYARIPKRKDVK